MLPLSSPSFHVRCFLLPFFFLPSILMATHRSSSSSSFCVFPEARERPFFFDIRSDTAPRSVILDTVVEPPDASMSIANIRSNNLPENLDIYGHLELEKRSNGQFLVVTTGPGTVIQFPPYPATINQTLLYITVRCNGHLHPLITIHVHDVNPHSPEFIGAQPYEMSIPKNVAAGALFDTPLRALDMDPAEQYPISFGVEPPFNRDFALVIPFSHPDYSASDESRLFSLLPPAYSRRFEDWHARQFPPVIQLKVLAKSLAAKGRHVFYLNVSATDNVKPEPRVSYAQLKVSLKEPREMAARFSRAEYFGNFTKEMVPGSSVSTQGEPIQAIFPAQRAGDRIEYMLDPTNPYSQLFEMDPETGRIRLAQRMPEAGPQTVELDVMARLKPRDNPLAESGQMIRTRLSLTDQSEVRLIYFTQCHYEAHLAENPSAYTRVLQFSFRGDVQGVELLNGTELFKVNADGVMNVRPGVELDRESTERIVVKARLKSGSAPHPRSLELCQIATADIHIDDVNDHSPQFTRRSYRFRIDARPFNNTEVGSLRAVDGDSGEFGRIRYRLLDEFSPDGQGGEEPLPFVLFQADGAATLFFVVKPAHLKLPRQPYQPQSEYTFTVEAYDAVEDPRTARVTVNVRLADLTEEEERDQRDQKKQKKNESGKKRMAEEEMREEEERMEDGGMKQQDEPPPMAQMEERDETEEELTGKEKPERTRALSAPTLVFESGADQELRKTGEPLADDVPSDGLIRFDADKYTFRLSGPYKEGQTIGMVRVRQMGQMAEEEGKGNQVEFAVEEGIAGFVGVDSATGRLFVGPWLLQDRFEEIRFSVAAQHPADGRVLATALVSVLIDDLGPPRFSAAHYQFEMEAGDGGWPRTVGQVKAFGNNGSDAELGPEGMVVYALDPDQNSQIGEWLGVDEQSGEIIARGEPPGGMWAAGDRRRAAQIQFGVKACHRSNMTMCGRASVELVVKGGKKGKEAGRRERGRKRKKPEKHAEEARTGEGPDTGWQIEFIPLPRTVFLATGKQPGSPVLRVSVRALDPRDGSWHLLPLSAFRDGDEVVTNRADGDDQSGSSSSVQVEYSVEGAPPGIFRMRDNVLVLAGQLQPGELNLTIRAHLARRHPTPEGPAREEIARRSVQHPLRVVVMADGARQRYPVFERISYEFEVGTLAYIDPSSAHFPLAMAPPLNATLALQQPILFSMFPARPGDPTDGLELDPHNGQLLIHRRFLEAALATARRNGTGTETSGSGKSTAEVFIVVRATNRAQPEYYSDASVALLVHPKDLAPNHAFPGPLAFDSPLYRFIVSEDAPADTVLNIGAPICLLHPDQHPRARILLGPLPSDTNTTLADHFRLLDNGSLVLTQQIDLELMEDASKGVIELELAAEDPNPEGPPSCLARIQVQVLDVDEHAPHIDPYAPEFRLRPPLVAGQAIGRLMGRDPDFSDRQPDSLTYRPISGNASELVHVQRDGVLRVKDPERWREMGGRTAELLVEVRDTGGKTSETMAKFVMEEEPRDEPRDEAVDRRVTEATTGEPDQEQGEEQNVESKGTTIEVPLPTTVPGHSTPTNLALFSVRDSLSPQQIGAPLRFELENSSAAETTQFRLDPRSGELFMEESAAFGRAKVNLEGAKEAEEHELRVRIMDAEGRMVGRRVYTVRLVQARGTGEPTIIEEEEQRGNGTGRVEETRTEEPKTEPMGGVTEQTKMEEEEGTRGWSVDQQPHTSYSSDGTPSPSESNQPSSSTSTSSTIPPSPPSSSSVSPSSSSSSLPPSSSSVTSSTSVPSSSFPPSSSSVPPPPSSSSSFSPSGPTTLRRAPATPTPHSPLHFVLPRYHWVMAEPAKEALIGRLDVQGEGQLEGISVEPAQFRTWFRLDPKTGELFLREVPDQLFGRQRAEFRARLASMDGHWADTQVVVDLNLPPKTEMAERGEAGKGEEDETGRTASGITETQTTPTTQSVGGGNVVEIAENSDQDDGVNSKSPTVAVPSPSTSPSPAADEQSPVTPRTASTNGQHVEEGSPEVAGQPATESNTLTPAAESTQLEFGAAEFRAMLPEGRYGNSGAQLSLRPHPLAEGMPRGIQFSIIEERGQQWPDIADTENGGLLPFFVRQNTGELIAFAEIDREERAQYQFRVRAFDPIHNRSAIARVSVHILDVNDNFPQFLEPLPRVIPIGRLTPPGTTLSQFHATDPDEGPHGTVTFRMEEAAAGDAEERGLFIVEPDGRLIIGHTLPPGGQDTLDLRISAVDGGRPALRTEHKLRVEIFAEGQPVEFKQSEYVADPVPAGAAQNGTFVAQVVAGTSDQQIEYTLIDPPLANLFTIDPQSGQIRMGRRPVEAERDREWVLNVSAVEGQRQQNTAHTTVRVLVESLPESSPEPAAPPTPTSESDPKAGTNESGAGGCHFAQRVYHAEIAENTEGRQRLTTLKLAGGGCGTARMKLQTPNIDAFELDERSGDLYAVQPLDRERKSMHMLVANLMIGERPRGVATVREVEMPEEGERAEKPKRSTKDGRERTGRDREGGTLFNGVVEQAKAKLAENQALVLVRVLDRNDNAPKLQQLNRNGQIVFVIDWQAALLSPIGRVRAQDPDEHPQLQFSLAPSSSDLFSINSSSGVVQLMRSLASDPSDQYPLTVSVNDGQHTATAPLLIYKLQPGTNIVLLVINQPADQVDVLRAIRHMNALLEGLEVDVLVKQVFIGADGSADPRRTHLLAYALDKQSREPVEAAKLKELLEAALGNGTGNGTQASTSTPGPVADSPLRYLASIWVPDSELASSNSPFRLSTAEIVLLAISALLVCCVCMVLFLLLRCCKKRQEAGSMESKSDVQYMLDTQQAGPRPYNVKLITRTTAQAATAPSRRLPGAVEECTLSPESRATMVASAGLYGGGGQRRRGRGAGGDTTETSTGSSAEGGGGAEGWRRRGQDPEGMTYERYEEEGEEEGEGSEGDRGPMVDRMTESVEQSPQMARGAPQHEPPPPPSQGRGQHNKQRQRGTRPQPIRDGANIS